MSKCPLGWLINGFVPNCFSTRNCHSSIHRLQWCPNRQATIPSRELQISHTAVHPRAPIRRDLRGLGAFKPQKYEGIKPTMISIQKGDIETTNETWICCRRFLNSQLDRKFKGFFFALCFLLFGFARKTNGWHSAAQRYPGYIQHCSDLRPTIHPAVALGDASPTTSRAVTVFSPFWMSWTLMSVTVPPRMIHTTFLKGGKTNI